jgi:hypothetical protein
MSCGGIHADVLGALILSVGLVALMLGFYGGLFDRRERVILGAWIMRAC